MKHPPCKDCPSKGCGKKHDTCELYQAWREEMHECKKHIGDLSRIRGDIARAVIRNRRLKKWGR